MTILMSESFNIKTLKAIKEKNLLVIDAVAAVENDALPGQTFRQIFHAFGFACNVKNI